MENESPAQSLVYPCCWGNTTVLSILLADPKVVDAVNTLNTTGTASLHNTAVHGHVLVGRMLIKAGADINVISKYNDKPLYFATIHRQRAMLWLLIGAGADVNERDKHGNSHLSSALSEGYDDVVRIYCEAGFDVNCRKHGMTPLHTVSGRGHRDVARVLIGAGADVNAVDRERRTPMFVAFVNKQFYVARLLADAGAHVDPEYEAEHASELRLWTAVLRGDLDELRRRIDAGDSVDQAPQGGVVKGLTALWLAVNLGRQDAARMLANAGAHIDPVYEIRHAHDLRLWTAVLRGDLDELRHCIDAGESVDQAPQIGRAKGLTALWLAVALGREDAAHILNNAGSTVDLFDPFGWPILCLASENDHDEVISSLLSRADINRVIGHDGARICKALDNSFFNLVKLMIGAGASANTADGHHNSLLHKAVSKNSLEIVSIVVRAGAKLNSGDWNSRTPLDRALENGYYDIARLLADAGASVYSDSWPSPIREMPLWTAAMNGDLQKLQKRIAAGDDVNQTPRFRYADNCTALWMASALGREDAARMLIQAGADVNAGNRAPLHEALLSGSVAMARLIADAGACIDPEYEAEHANELRLWTAVLRGDLDELRRRIDAGDSVDQAPQVGVARGWTGLFIAVTLGYVEAACLLIQAGADVNHHFYDGMTPLHLATRAGSIEMVSMLLQTGANIDVVDNTGHTPLLAAVRLGHGLVAKVLIDAGANVHPVLSNKQAVLQSLLGAPSININAVSYTEAFNMLYEAGATVDGATATISPLVPSDVIRAIVPYNTHFWLAANNDAPMLAVELAGGLDPNMKTENGMTLLHWACAGDAPECVQLLLDAGAEEDSKSEYPSEEEMDDIYEPNDEEIELLWGVAAQEEAEAAAEAQEEAEPAAEAQDEAEPAAEAQVEAERDAVQEDLEPVLRPNTLSEEAGFQEESEPFSLSSEMDFSFSEDE